QRGRVALAATTSVDWIIAMYACALAGMALVPISPSVTDREAAYLLSHARVALVLTVESVGDQHVLNRVRAVAKTLSPQPAVQNIAEVIRDARHDWLPKRTVKPDDEFLIQYTSGTTGLPKAAVLSHRAALNIARIYGQANAAQPGEQWLNPLPLHHVGGT